MKIEQKNLFLERFFDFLEQLLQKKLHDSKKNSNFAHFFEYKWSMYTEVLRIIEGGLNNDVRKIVSYSQKLAVHFETDGDISMSRSIRDVLDVSHSHMATMDQFINAPVDADSRLQMVEVIPPIKGRTNIVLENLVEKQIDDFIDLVNKRNELLNKGVEIKSSMLLYGMPGCGKTSIAHYISEQTNLPLIIARLDSLISSLLGNTAKNIRKIFEFAEAQPCILFLDEFDAIAKARDDVHELGELKRVINSLLQNIDAMTSDSVLIAATNHAELLDRAVWRRFQSTIEIVNPSQEVKQQILKIHIGDFPCEFINDEKSLIQLSKLMEASSPSDIRTIINQAKAKSVIRGEEQLTYARVVQEIYIYTQHNTDRDGLIKFMSQANVSQATISQQIEVSLRQVKQSISKTNKL